MSAAHLGSLSLSTHSASTCKTYIHPVNFQKKTILALSLLDVFLPVVAGFEGSVLADAQILGLLIGQL